MRAGVRGNQALTTASFGPAACASQARAAPLHKPPALRDDDPEARDFRTSIRNWIAVYFGLSGD